MTSNDADSRTLYVDKCTQCETYFAMTDSADLMRSLNAHELEAHGAVQPDRPDHRAVDDR